MLAVWLISKPGSCIPPPCLWLLWVLEGSALLILELSNSQAGTATAIRGQRSGLCWEGCQPGSLCRLGQAWQSLQLLPMSDVANAPFAALVLLD